MLDFTKVSYLDNFTEKMKQSNIQKPIYSFLN